MKTTIESIQLQTMAPDMNVIIVESGAINGKTPLLIFLHGRGESSEFGNFLPHVFDHYSPPFQAILGRLMDVIVIAPQAPFNSKNDWNWRTLVPQLNRYIINKFQTDPSEDRQVYAAGFSRGGLGVLQLIKENRELISKWAIIDPQNAVDDKEENEIFEALNNTDTKGWLRYGNHHPSIKSFSDRLKRDCPGKIGNVEFVEELDDEIPANHTKLGFYSYKGSNLNGTQNLYDFLGLNWK